MSLGQSCISSYLFVGGEEGLNFFLKRKRKESKDTNENRKEKNKTWNNIKEVRKRKGEKEKKKC